MIATLHRTVAATVLLLSVLVAPLSAQVRPELVNGGFEQGELGGSPEGWLFRSSSGGLVALTTEAAFAGERSVLLDSGEAPGERQMTANLMQPLEATPWRGKRVRLRAAVRTAELVPGASARLWLRVDRPDGARGAFDNMGDRPIVGEEWAHYEIVADVAEDAERILVGAFVVGNGKAWLDDFTFEVVDPMTPTTPAAGAQSSEDASAGDEKAKAKAKEKEKEDAAAERRPPRRPRDPLIDKALAEAEAAPQQPFWTWWLALPAGAMLLFVVGLWPTRQQVGPATLPVEIVSSEVGWLRWFALRFAVCYWLLYCLPSPFSAILSWTGRTLDQFAAKQWLPDGLSEPFYYLGGKLSEGHGALESWLAHLTAESVFGIEGPLVPPNGSGDTTMSYLVTFDWAVIALALATIWTLLLRKVPRRDASVDLLRSFLRYVLAFAMLSYGLSKVSMDRNQFSEIAPWRLDKTWGDSSPMGLVWGFMGASRPYTIFAGLGEVVAASLLIWRHTALLGALVAVGVMTNVVMLNYCYDVPVKLYSSHLLVMGMLIAVPDARRLLALLLWNRNPTHQGTPSVWAGLRYPWVRWVPKALVVTMCFLLPIGLRAFDLWNYQAPTEAKHGGYRLTDRGYRWINEVPFHR